MSYNVKKNKIKIFEDTTSAEMKSKTFYLITNSADTSEALNYKLGIFIFRKVYQQRIC